MDPYIGKMLDNRYEILELIGRGGMANVYKAKCHRLDRLVAVKILHSDLAQNADFRRRFMDESRAVAQLSHPNIVSVYDVSCSDDVDYIVMELIDGVTLKQYMERRGQMDWREALHFITQIMRGLSHAHSRGIIHRDIKPHNIMILKDGSVKVAEPHTGLDKRLGGLVGAAHDIVDARRLFVWLAPKERARHIRAVAAAASTNIEQHYVAALEYGVVGLVVRVAGVGAKAHDRRKAEALAVVLAIQTKHLVGNLALRHALVNELDRVGHHGVVSGRGHAHELLLGGILVGARGGDGKVAQEKLAGGVALHERHQKAGAHDGIDAERLDRIDLARDGIGHDIGIGVVGNAGVVILGQLMQRVDQDHGLAIARE